MSKDINLAEALFSTFFQLSVKELRVYLLSSQGRVLALISDIEMCHFILSLRKLS